MAILRAIKLILTLHCEESTQLQSAGYERQLTFAERWAVRLHYISCKACRAFRKQLQFLQTAAKRGAERASQEKLPSALREQIAKKLQ